MCIRDSNNTAYTYNDVVATDYVTATVGQYVINTQIPSTTSALYIVLKMGAPVPGVTELDYVIADNQFLLSSYQYTNSMGVTTSKYRITLPVKDGVQQTLAYAGQWTITFYNYRENQRQSLSKALRPSADF